MSDYQSTSSLSDYEKQQVEEIASWKASHPNPFGELVRRVAHPAASFLESLIPDKLAIRALEVAYHSAESAALLGVLEREAGVSSIAEMRQKPLEVCDALAIKVARGAETVGTIDGALTGAGGVFTSLADIPLLFVLCLRTIMKTGHCYGYPLDRRSDKAWVLGAFAVALSHSQQKRLSLVERLREVEELLIEDTQEQVIVEEAMNLITQLEVFEAIPLLGIVGGALLNLSSVQRMDITARRLFQERRLRDEGKVDEIAPSAATESLMAMHGWSGAAARAGRHTVFGLAFGVSFGGYLIAEMVKGLRGKSQPSVA